MAVAFQEKGVLQAQAVGFEGSALPALFVTSEQFKQPVDVKAAIEGLQAQVPSVAGAFKRSVQLQDPLFVLVFHDQVLSAGQEQLVLVLTPVEYWAKLQGKQFPETKILVVVLQDTGLQMPEP